MYWLIAGIIGGYVASIFTWPKVWTWYVGTANAALALEEKAKKLRDDLKNWL